MLRMVCRESLLQSLIADHIAQHPPHAHRFAAVKFLVVRGVDQLIDEWFTSSSDLGAVCLLLFRFSAAFRAERCGCHVIQRGLASTLMFQIQRLREVGETLVDPRPRREKAAWVS